MNRGCFDRAGSLPEDVLKPIIFGVGCLSLYMGLIVIRPPRGEPTNRLKRACIIHQHICRGAVWINGEHDRTKNAGLSRPGALQTHCKSGFGSTPSCNARRVNGASGGKALGPNSLCLASQYREVN